jgi:hypothetical protein
MGAAGGLTMVAVSRSMAVGVVGAGLVVAGGAGAGCDDAPAPASIALTVAIDGVGVEGLSSTGGYAVTVTVAALCIEQLQTHAGEAVLASRGMPSLGEVRDALLSFSSAKAHPGHYDEGGLMGEVTGTTVVDLLATTATTMPVGDGISGHHGSASITLCTDAGLDGALLLEGTASRDGTDVGFRFVVQAPEVIEGIPVDVELGGDGALVVHVDLAGLLGRVDFDAFPAQTPPVVPTAPPPGSQPDNAVGRAIRASSTYHVELLP